MVTRIIYNLMLLPGVKYYFNKDLFYVEGNALENGEEILFLLQKEEKKREELKVEDFLPIAAIGEKKKETEEGNVEILIRDRVKVTALYHEDGTWTADYEPCAEVLDFTEEEKKALYKDVQEEFLKFMRNFQWDIRTAAYLMHIDTLPQFICAVAPYLNISWEDKYAVIEKDSVKAVFTESFLFCLLKLFCLEMRIHIFGYGCFLCLLRPAVHHIFYHLSVLKHFQPYNLSPLHLYLRL